MRDPIGDATPPLAEFRTAPLEGASVVSVAGEIDLSNHGELETAVGEARETQPRAVILDLSGVLYLDSIAIRTLIVLARHAVPLIVVVPPGVSVRRTVDVAGLRSILPVHDTLEEAVAAPG